MKDNEIEIDVIRVLAFFLMCKKKNNYENK